MAYALTRRGRILGVTAGFAAATLVLAGCSPSDGNTTEDGSAPLTIGTTDTVTAIDPAGSYDSGSFAVQTQVFPLLMNTPSGSPDAEPDLASTAEFTTPTQYTVTLEPGLSWANGNELTSSDVKFSFDRQLAIASEDGPSSLLYNLKSVETPDASTVVFNLVVPNDQVFSQILASPAGSIVDEESFSATEVTADADIVDANAFGGQYVITSYDPNNQVGYQANPDYNGLLGAAKTDVVNVKYYTDSSNLKLDVEEGNIDVAYRSLTAPDVADLRTSDSVEVVDGPGGEIRFITFNTDTQPFGATTKDADSAKALAVRQAVAHLVDREAIADEVYQGTYTPLFSSVPTGLTGATEPLKDLYGDGAGAPDAGKAKAALAAAGITGKVALDLHYSSDFYGPLSGEEYALVKKQLEESGLFSVTLKSAKWAEYSKERADDAYPAFQLGAVPDYSDADTYLSKLYLTDNFLTNNYQDPAVNGLVLEQAITADRAARTALIEEIQATVAEQLPTVPLLQGTQVAVTGTTVTGVADTLNASYKFRYGALAKG
jgi:peptide/nickel transport system substrate-binding protein